MLRCDLLRKRPTASATQSLEELRRGHWRETLLVTDFVFYHQTLLTVAQVLVDGMTRYSASLPSSSSLDE
jgi:hypothetical protein